MYAIVKTGGKQYRVEQGTSLVVERLRADEGAKVSLEPLLFVDGSKVIEGADGVQVEAKVLAHERGPKLRVVKFKPKRGYKRRNGHRQELTRLEVTSIKGSTARARRPASAESKEEAAARPAAADKPAKPGSRARRAASAVAAEKSAAKPAAGRRAASVEAEDETAAQPAAGRRAASAEAEDETPAKPAPRRRTTTPKKETSDGS